MITPQLDTNHAVTKRHKLTIASDSETHFIGSNWGGLKERPAVNIESLSWKGKLDELKEVAWIADREMISQDEAVKGGWYTFRRTFSLPRASRVTSAMLYVEVNDFCKLEVNGTELHDVDAVASFDLHHHLHAGQNKLEFVVTNRSFASFPQGIGPAENPYGLRFKLVVNYTTKVEQVASTGN